jgi:hypothetical protein
MNVIVLCSTASKTVIKKKKKKKADISASSDPILFKLCSLDSSHQGVSNGGICVRFEALYLELFAISHFYINVTQTILLIT